MQQKQCAASKTEEMGKNMRRCGYDAHVFFGIIYEKVDKEEQASQQKFEQNFSLLQHCRLLILFTVVHSSALNLLALATNMRSTGTRKKRAAGPRPGFGLCFRLGFAASLGLPLQKRCRITSNVVMKYTKVAIINTTYNCVVDKFLI